MTENTTLRTELRDGLYSEILPGLWQGGTHDDEELPLEAVDHPFTAPIALHEFDVVASFYLHSRAADSHVAEIRYPFLDHNLKDADIPVLMQIARFLHAEWRRGKRVLSRCQAGWNRSGLVMTLVLMLEGYPADEAIQLIRERRSPYALCNDYFEEFLLELDPAELGVAA